ncbi:ABC transporter permease [Ensifer adhaerens]|uniref:Iron ABC transporter permease n=1 Tax=Ensifer adhaerens TaxID=106592 RepID=A0A9Q9DEM0_ENSAD|nr:iron ABC transporter permease [Ensifer adhaerens]USJ28525.1 iron ABC transporter permease [Ensifer adhaerens]
MAMKLVVRTSINRLIGEPVKLITLLGVLVALFGLVVYPLALLVKFSATDTGGAPSIAPLVSAFTYPGMARAALNSVSLTVWVALWANVIALPLAWLVARTDMPGKMMIRIGVALAFVIPSFITVISWIFLAAPNAGYLNALAKSVLGIDFPLFNIVSFNGLIFIETAHLFPLIFFTVSTALTNVDPSHEQAARILGAGRIRVLATITLPMVAPAVMAGTILVMLDALSAFGAPAAIGTMANFSLLTTKIYQLLSFPPRLDLAAATALPIVLATCLFLWLQRYVTGGNKYTSLTGKATAAQPVTLGKWRTPAFLLAFAIIFVTALLPTAALVVLSLLKGFGLDLAMENMTFRNFTIVANPSRSSFDAILHSLGLAVVCAGICVLLGVICAWLVERTNFPGRGAVSGIIMLTYGFPSIAFAVAIMLGYIDLFYGTFTILAIAYVAKNLPVSFVMFRSSFKQLSPDMEEVARVVGAGWLRSMLQVTLPLLKASAWAAGLLVFAVALRELSMSAILVQPHTEVMATSVLEFLETGAVELSAAMAVIIVLCSVASLLVLRLIAGRGRMEV